MTNPSKRSFAGWLVLVILNVASPGPALAGPLASSVVCVQNIDDPANPQQGSGFIVHADERSVLIVTLIHVIQNSKNLTVTFENDRFNPEQAFTVRLEQNVDDGFALLRVERGRRKGVQTVSIVPRTNQLSDGAALQVIGCPLSSQADWPQSECRLRGQAGNDLEIEGNISQGNSGGPVFFEGKLVGVVYQTNNHSSDAYKSDKLAALLDGWGVSYDAAPIASERAVLAPVTTPADLAAGLQKRLPDGVLRGLSLALLALGVTPVEGTLAEPAVGKLARLESRIVSAARMLTTNPMTGSPQFNYRVELEVVWLDPALDHPVSFRAFETEKSLTDLGEFMGFQTAADGAIQKIAAQLRGVIGPDKEKNH